MCNAYEIYSTLTEKFCRVDSLFETKTLLCIKMTHFLSQFQIGSILSQFFRVSLTHFHAF